ncbi:MAG TPA: PPOX class F420-dependent oxidoreductase [Candidatus Nanopelagicales bacterium]|nr:PPOX class F420-dependent oxidoreductase [Candidatus Nanopelagicales bacterium]
MTDRLTRRDPARLLDPAGVLGRAEYMRLTTFRQDGTPVPTPVWVMPADPEWPGTAGDQLWVWVNPAAGKVKRLRRDGSCQVAPCTVRGVPLGRAVAAVGRVLPESSVPIVLRALTRKYGLRGRLSTLRPRWGFAPAGALGIRLAPAPVPLRPAPE